LENPRLGRYGGLRSRWLERHVVETDGLVTTHACPCAARAAPLQDSGRDRCIDAWNLAIRCLGGCQPRASLTRRQNEGHAGPRRRESGHPAKRRGPSVRRNPDLAPCWHSRTWPIEAQVSGHHKNCSERQGFGACLRGIWCRSHARDGSMNRGARGVPGARGEAGGWLASGDLTGRVDWLGHQVS
jgi:hypothetical protein